MLKATSCETRLLREPLPLSTLSMPFSRRLRTSSVKTRRGSSLYLFGALVLCVYSTSVLSYAQSRGPPDRRSLRVKWNVTGETEGGGGMKSSFVLVCARIGGSVVVGKCRIRCWLSC